MNQNAVNDAILRIVLNGHTYGQREAASIVGGRSRLNTLIGNGSIRATKKNTKQNAKLFCNAYDVLQNAVITR